jgi:hypothetical protein
LSSSSHMSEELFGMRAGKWRIKRKRDLETFFFSLHISSRGKHKNDTCSNGANNVSGLFWFFSLFAPEKFHKCPFYDLTFQTFYFLFFICCFHTLQLFSFPLHVRKFYMNLHGFDKDSIDVVAHHRQVKWSFYSQFFISTLI